MLVNHFGMIEECHVDTVEQYLATASTVLELGCGSVPLDSKSRFARRYVAIDRDREKLCQKLSRNIYYINADVKSMPCRANSIDLVLALGLFGNLDVYTNSELVEHLETMLLQEVKIVKDDEIDGARMAWAGGFAGKRAVTRSEFDDRLRSAYWNFLPTIIPEVLAEACRALKPQGRLLISNHQERLPYKRFISWCSELFLGHSVHYGVERYLLILEK